MKQYDFVVIGSGIAGLTFALKAAQHGSVAVITKRKGVDSNTAVAQGGIACVTSDEDSFELHVADTLEAGAGLCDEAAVRTIVMEGPKRVGELVALGLHFDDREIGAQGAPRASRRGEIAAGARATEGGAERARGSRARAAGEPCAAGQARGSAAATSVTRGSRMNVGSITVNARPSPATPIRSLRCSPTVAPHAIAH